MNQMTLKGNWNELKGKVRERWGQLTDNDLQQIQGRSEQLLGKLQSVYGLSKEEAQRQIAEFEEDCGCNENRDMAGATASSTEDSADETEFDDEPRRREDEAEY